MWLLLLAVVLLWLLLVVAAVALLLAVLRLTSVLEATLLWRVSAADLLLTSGVVRCRGSTVALVWLLSVPALLLIAASVALALWRVVGVVVAVLLLLLAVVLLAIVLLTIALLAVAALIVVRA